MNKQQLASKIWQSANNMRSKIEANEYKDYILGFIFYKFLSEKEEEVYIKDNGTRDGIEEYLVETDLETVKYFQDKIGYFIEYKNLFSTWLNDKDFDVSNVSDALNAFNRLIANNYKKVYEKIFDTLQAGLSKLGDSSGTQTKAIVALLNLIKDIPMDDKQGYDVLGFIYEYLISMFAANAGKKAGEFYTPHEVSILMSEIVAHHLRNRDKIDIYEVCAHYYPYYFDGNITPSIKKEFESEKAIHNENHKTKSDSVIRMMAMLYDFNYDESFDILVETDNFGFWASTVEVAPAAEEEFRQYLNKCYQKIERGV